MPLKEQKYKYNQSILKVYGNSSNQKIKIITMRVLRTSGVEDDKQKYERCTVNTEKLDENIQRSKSKIQELAYCNDWEYFFTATLDPNKGDRTDLEVFHKCLTSWIKQINRYYSLSIKYLLIPELHKDRKSWHMHGFIMGLPIEHLKQFEIGDVMGKSLVEKVKKGDIVYNWLSYAKKFGFCDLEPIRNHEAVSKYVTKYIHKELAKNVTALNAHQYYHSRGLNTAKVIKKGTMSANIVPSFENDYCSVAWLDYTDELLKQLENSFT